MAEIAPQNGSTRAATFRMHGGRGPNAAGRWLLAAALGSTWCVSWPHGAAAQVNVEGLRKALTEPGVHGKLSGAITTYHGNTLGTELGGAALMGYREERQLVYLATNANYSNLGGDVRVANGFLHFRYNYAFNPLGGRRGVHPGRERSWTCGCSTFCRST